MQMKHQYWNFIYFYFVRDYNNRHLYVSCPGNFTISVTEDTS